MDVLEALGREIEQLEPGRGRRYGTELRRRVVGAVRRARAAGRSWASISRALGTPVKTLTGWLDEAPAVLPLVPVTVVADVAAQREVVVVSPGGYVVEGLDLDGVAELLRKLS